MIEPLEPRLAPATFLVTTLAVDSGTGSLRDALEKANSAPGLDTIKFAKSAHGTLALTTELLITDDLNLIGPGAALVTIDAGGAPLLTIDDGTEANKTVTISGLTFTHAAGTVHAAMQVMENLVLKQSVVSHMDSALSGQGILSKAGGAKLELSCTQFIGCRGEAAVSVFSGSAIVNKVQFIGNSGLAGGGLRFASHDGNLTVTASTFLGNIGSAGGALHLTVDEGFTATIRNSTFTANEATSETPGEGGGAIFVDAAGAFLQDKNLFTGNHAPQMGGAILLANASSAILKRDTFLANHAGDSGGALAVPGSGAAMRLSIQSARFDGNQAGASGGGLFFRGDGELASSPTRTTLSILATAFVRNRAGDHGGGLNVDDETFHTRTSRLDLKTLTFNYNDAGGDGGGALLRTTADTYLVSDKFLQNHAGQGGGGLFLDTLGDFTDLTALTFNQNFAAFGGALAAVADGGATLDRSIFRLNYATDPAGPGGGAIHLAPSDLQIVISQTRITDNFSASTAGGIRTFTPLDAVLLPGNTIRNNYP